MGKNESMVTKKAAISGITIAASREYDPFMQVQKDALWTESGILLLRLWGERFVFSDEKIFQRAILLHLPFNNIHSSPLQIPYIPMHHPHLLHAKMEILVHKNI